MDTNERIASIEINMESQKSSLEYYLKFILEKNGHQDSEELVKKFNEEHEKLLKKHEKEDFTELSLFYRHVMMFKPALNTILKPGKEYDELCDTMVTAFNVVLDRVRKQVNDRKAKKKPSGPILPGSSKAFELRYFCSVCNESFEIPPEMKAQIDNSEEKVELPKHHDKEMVIKIVKIEEKTKPDEEFEEIKIYPAELLMGHSDSADQNVEYLNILSVGIDVGSSTSHLIFSHLTLKRETGFFNMSNRFNLVNREIIYEGNIIFTPLIDRFSINIEEIVDFCKKEYENAKITPEMVDTGAVIVTGETAKKQNAAEIVRRLSSESGKFVSASAGPNFESMLGAMGSGMVALSRENQKTLMNIDIGGGTSNIAIASNGDVISTSCINVGGRLLGIDKDFKIWRIDEPTEWIMKELGIKYKLGDTIPEGEVRKITNEYAKALLEVMQGPATNKIAKLLMLTDDIEITGPIDGILFSGGIAEMIYERGEDEDTDKNSNPYNDIGKYLAEDIYSLSKKLNLPIIEPENKIRATVIGAGAFSLSISGSTCYYDESINLPIENVPVVPINFDFKDLLAERHENVDKHKEKIALALKNFNLVEGEDDFALYIKDLIIPPNLIPLAKVIETSLPNSVVNNKLVLIILGGDGGKMLGLTIKRETTIKNNLFCLDELDLEAGDWIDIGAPLQTEHRKAFPVTVKSLVFNKEKKDSCA
ncbi:MAG: ethanolamine ammonia-lyase reactivating factor EutA [Candidatus Lokiarchaeota archaeon]|nr:ethanolamine ammonia-lyase reactivating factor EutA [Candidatus Lokiarchaeota archaeon]